METLRTIYDNYLGVVAQLQRKRKPLQGAFGLGGGPAEDPCHQQLVRDVEQALSQMTQEQREQAVEFILRAPVNYKGEPMVYWTFMAAHGATLPYLPSLPVQQAKPLRAWYQKAYPRWERMPCQEQVLTALKQVR